MIEQQADERRHARPTGSSRRRGSDRSSALRGTSATPAARPIAGSATGSATSSCVKLPVMRPSVVIRASMRGADCTRPSRMIASGRPMFSPVTLPNFRPPSLFSVKLTAGWLFSSSGRTGIPQVASGDGGYFFDQVVDGAGVAGGAADAGQDLACPAAPDR